MDVDNMTKEDILKLLADKRRADAEQEARLVGKVESLLDELIALAKEGRVALSKYKPLDWALLYGPRGTEIKRPGEP